MTETDMKQIALRLPRDVLERVAQHAKRLQRENRGMKVTRADTIRTLLIDALDSVEATAAK